MYVLTAEKLLKLADKHIQLYERRLASGSPVVNAAKCHAYLIIWKSIKEKKGVDLSELERQEIVEALDSGEYDDLLQ